MIMQKTLLTAGILILSALLVSCNMSGKDTAPPAPQLMPGTYSGTRKVMLTATGIANDTEDFTNEIQILPGLKFQETTRVLDSAIEIRSGLYSLNQGYVDAIHHDTVLTEYDSSDVTFDWPPKIKKYQPAIRAVISRGGFDRIIRKISGIGFYLNEDPSDSELVEFKIKN